MSRPDTAMVTISELREFAGFTSAEQRYIKRSLDVGLGRHDAVELWSRDEAEAVSIRAQYDAYADIEGLRRMVGHVDGVDNVAPFIGELIRMTTFDLSQERIDGFCAYRFLYERLLGAEVRPWLPAAFCAASALPFINPVRRKGLLQSISEAAVTAFGWSTREPSFYPEFVENEAA